MRAGGLNGGTWGSLPETRARRNPKPAELRSPCWGWRDLYLGKHPLGVLMDPPFLDEEGLAGLHAESGLLTELAVTLALLRGLVSFQII